MTKFRSKLLGAVLLLAVSGCSGPSGVPLSGPLGHDLDYAYIPLKRSVFLVTEMDAGGVAIGDGVAVTAAHAEDIIPSEMIIGVSTNYDLMFFRTDRTKPALAIDVPRLGQKIVAYAHYTDGMYKADGVVVSLDAEVKPRCDSCVVQSTFAFDGNAGPGYSGGPAIDAESGKLIGIVFGYRDKPDGGRTIHAYPMSLVFAELARIRQAKHAAAQPPGTVK